MHALCPTQVEQAWCHPLEGWETPWASAALWSAPLGEPLYEPGRFSNTGTKEPAKPNPEAARGKRNQGREDGVITNPVATAPDRQRGSRGGVEDLENRWRLGSRSRRDKVHTISLVLLMAHRVKAWAGKWTYVTTRAKYRYKIAWATSLQELQATKTPHLDTQP